MRGKGFSASNKLNGLIYEPSGYFADWKKSFKITLMNRNV